MLCTECKKEQEKRIPNEEKENAQPAEKVCSDVHTTLKSKRSAALILLTGATLLPSGGSFFVLWRFYKLFTAPALTSYSFGGIIIQYDIRCLSYDRS